MPFSPPASLRSPAARSHASKLKAFRLHSIKGCIGGSSGRCAEDAPSQSTGVAGQPEPLLHRRGQRRHLEERRCGTHVDADLRRRADRIDRRACRRAERSASRSTPAAARDCSGPISRSATVSTSRPTAARRGRTSACATGSRSARWPSIRTNPNRAFRRGRSAIRTAPNDAARHLPHRSTAARRLQRVLFKTTDAGAFDVVHRSERSTSRLRYALGGAPGAVGNRRLVRDARQRHLQIDRRRHDVDAADARACPRAWDVPRSRSRRAIRTSSTPTPTSKPKATTRRALSQRRCGRALYANVNDADEHRAARRRPRFAGGRSAAIAQTRLSHEHVDVSVDRRRQERSSRSKARRAATTITPSGSIRTIRRSFALASDQGATISVNGGAHVELVVQPADGADVSRERRRPLPVLGLRRPARERFGVRAEPRRLGRDDASAIGTRSARKSTATSFPIRCIPAFSSAAKSNASTSGPGETQEVSPIALPTKTYRVGAHRAARFRSVRPARALLRRRTSFSLPRRRPAAGDAISPDLTRAHPGVPAVLGAFESDDPQHGAHRGVVYAHRAVVPAPRNDLGRNRRRADVDHRATPASALDERDAAGSSRRGARSRRSTRRALTTTPPSSRSTASASTICARTSTSRATAATAGQLAVQRLARPAGQRGARKIRASRGCSMPPPKTAFTSRSTGARWQSLQLNLPHTSVRDASFTATISSSRRTAAASGFSTT